MGTKATFSCPRCRSTVEVPPKLAGKSGNCPVCDAVISFPAPKGVAGKKIRVRCPECKAGLTMAATALGKRVSCPKCKAAFPVTAENAKKVKPQAELALEKDTSSPREYRPAEKKVHDAWSEFQKSREDSYPVALWKACLYPYDALGALIFFVIGVPVTLAVVEAGAKYALFMAGGFESADKRSYIAAGVICLALGVALAMLSFFCSFLFAVTRVAFEGRDAIPVIQGMHHRSNLAGFCAWAAVYFGPGLFLAFRAGAEAGTLFAWSAPAAVLLAIGALLAPMGYIRSATQSATAGLNPVAAAQGIGATAKEYAYLWMVLLVATAIFVGLGYWVGCKASAAFTGGNPDYLVGIPLRIVAGLLYMFPAVVFARGTGLLLKYHADKLPFEAEVSGAEFKGQTVPQFLALAGVALLFLPLHREAKSWTEKGGQALAARKNLESIYNGLRRSDNKKHHPSSYKELEDRVGADRLVCPARPELDPAYGLIPLQSGARTKLIWIYETAPTHPDGETLHVLKYGGKIAEVTEGKLRELLELQTAYEEAAPMMKDKAYRSYVMGYATFTRREDAEAVKADAGEEDSEEKTKKEEP
jgi:hypothetical protein